jgi:hypothetical protein
MLDELISDWVSNRMMNDGLHAQVYLQKSNLRAFLLNACRDKHTQ